MTNVLRELAFEARQLKAQEKEAEKTPKNIPAPPKNEYTLTVAEYPDIVITKAMARGMKSLVLMVSAGAAFIKTEMNGKEPVSEELSENNFKNFAAGMPDIVLPDDFWADRITREIVCARNLIKLFKDDVQLEMFRRRAFGSVKYPLLGECFTDFGYLVDAYRKMTVLYMDVLNNDKSLQFLVNELSFVEELQKRFGLDGARKFLHEYEVSIVDVRLNSGHYDYRTGNFGYPDAYSRTYREFLRDSIPQETFKLDSFIEYVLYSSYRMGYAFSIKQFFQDWKDTLRMQKNIYGKIKDKYPRALPMAHMQLSQKTTMMRAEIDEKMFAEQAEKVCLYEGTYRGFAFVGPKRKQDFFDEAVSQASCIASYVDKFTRGECQILFMRHKETPETSYITVEIINGCVAQAKLAANAAISEKEEAILTEWVDRCNAKAVRGEQDGLTA